MSIEYKEEQILRHELDSNNPYIGYFSPKGDLVDYRCEKHRDSHSPIAQAFLMYISYIQDDKLHMGYYTKLDYKRLIESLNREIDSLDTTDKLREFEYQLLLFFRNVYQRDDIFGAMNRKIIIEPNCNDVKESLLTTHLKDICVQYLGYDSIERYDSNNSKIEPSNTVKPRIITSTSPNTNDKYYNYLIMDWEVKKFPRYTYNEETGIYELDTSNNFYENESEEVLAEEIKSIKKLIPMNERYKFFR